VNVEKTKAIQEFKPTSEQLEWVEGLKSALEEVELHQQGKIELRTLDELINEL
jgi:hypothetical protein